jgi:hypothetical protein
LIAKSLTSGVHMKVATSATNPTSKYGVI